MSYPAFLLLLLLKCLGVALLNIICATILLHTVGFALAVIVFRNPKLKETRLFNALVDNDDCLVNGRENGDKASNKRGYCQYFKYFCHSYSDIWWGWLTKRISRKYHEANSAYK